MIDAFAILAGYAAGAVVGSVVLAVILCAFERWIEPRITAWYRK